LAWTIEYGARAKTQLKRLDKSTARRLVEFLETRVSLSSNPRSFGASLKGSIFGGCWKYRVGDYRIIVDIQDQKMTVLVLQAGHRREIYKTR